MPGSIRCLLSELLSSARKDPHPWPLSPEPGILGVVVGKKPQAIKNVVLLSWPTGVDLSVAMTGPESCSWAGSVGCASSQLSGSLRK